MRPVLALLGLVLACDPAAPVPRQPPAEPPPSTTPPTPATPQPNEPPTPAAPKPNEPPTCKADIECDVCGTRAGCSCLLAGTPAAAESCGPMEHPCFAPPCHASSASCWQGRCVLRPAPAGPCNADADCEVRDDACKCDFFPALKSAPADAGCPGRGCGARPAKHPWQARCDPAAHRCVLARAG